MFCRWVESVGGMEGLWWEDRSVWNVWVRCLALTFRKNNDGVEISCWERRMRAERDEAESEVESSLDGCCTVEVELSLEQPLWMGTVFTGCGCYSSTHI